MHGSSKKTSFIRLYMQLESPCSTVIISLSTLQVSEMPSQVMTETRRPIPTTNLLTAPSIGIIKEASFSFSKKKLNTHYTNAELLFIAKISLSISNFFLPRNTSIELNIKGTHSYTYLRNSIIFARLLR